MLYTPSSTPINLSSYVQPIVREVPGAISPYMAQQQYNSYNYGQDPYGTAPYNGQVTQSSSGGLVNTGSFVILTITVASLLILTALVVRFWKRPATKAKSDQSNK